MVDQEFQSDMKYLPIECLFCQWNGVLYNYQVRFHIFIVILCSFIAKAHLEHIHNNVSQHIPSQHQKITMNCLLKELGCSEQVLIFIYLNRFV